MISIIIPKTPKEDISEALESIRQSTYKKYEIIVVDEGLERSAQRNIGIERSKGEYLLILDADQFIAPDLLEDCMKKIKNCNSIYIPEIIVTEGWLGSLS